ncbi:NADH dehydrogenase Fe-S protein subunit 4 ndufs4 [Cyanidiococcus yangmingshanensis]|uniref:NADH dehydrogenase [ubiquinone] iron-sulfur protein 4, mitochondrial n=1 Tax=Cyanidiococcus yangmingshanensis TaxID=2690220 RepID=A0A7J7IMA9_9RHOD|nr:NADH dehydrogenase Fe-S protein subunit 4 ndufs4 [Cyanidiococcus yangmingshanensis]
MRGMNGLYEASRFLKRISLYSQLTRRHWRRFSEEHGALGRVSGTPDEHRTRRLRIFRPARSPVQQGRGSRTQLWKAEFEVQDGFGRWTNPLMGWYSSGDPLSQTTLTFSSKEAAIQYAEKYGFQYIVYDPHEEPIHERKIVPFGRAMVHHWRHEAIPQYSSWNESESEQTTSWTSPKPEKP